MTDINTGGPAFPIKGPLMTSDEHGMTLRDYFAAKAMQGICASGPGNAWTNARLAAEAYDLAAAMLSARGTEKAREA